MTAKQGLICPHRITTYYHEEQSIDTARKILDADEIKKNRISTLVVEEMNSEGQYILLENFKYHASLLAIQPNTYIPCIVYPATNEINRLLHILKISIPLERMSWLFYNVHVMKLINDHNLKVGEISNLTKCNIKKYIFDTRIPEHIRVQAIKNHARGVCEEICRNRVIPEQIKPILYEHAVLPRNNAYRLTRKQFENMKMFFKYNHIPNSQLNDHFKMKKLMNDLIASDFEIKDHMKWLYQKHLGTTQIIRILGKRNPRRNIL